ncbi:Uncharacterised protein [Campylobacter hyointestinalis]|uniref:DUF5334 family protein n=2 Tax=Campylobacter hyointestinalis TaxID=198 RepID=UPI0007246A64|nr:DUF5334 family protein [Campylobacter hyointestinalis]CUU89660.1 Uncharacterised protein [Campylobacter hyointestinalis]
MKNFILLFIAVNSFAWSGYDYDNNTYVDIDKGNLVRSGRDIEIYDYKDGNYKDVEVQSIRNIGSSVEIEVYDYNNNEYRTFEMDR